MLDEDPEMDQKVVQSSRVHHHAEKQSPLKGPNDIYMLWLEWWSTQLLRNEWFALLKRFGIGEAGMSGGWGMTRPNFNWTLNTGCVSRVFLWTCQIMSEAFETARRHPFLSLSPSVGWCAILSPRWSRWYSSWQPLAFGFWGSSDCLWHLWAWLLWSSSSLGMASCGPRQAPLLPQAVWNGHKIQTSGKLQTSWRAWSGGEAIHRQEWTASFGRRLN